MECLILKEIATVLTEVVREEKWRAWLHLPEHFDRKANIFDLERQIVRCLPLGATFLQNGEGLQIDFWLLSDHVYDHEDHLFLLVGDLEEAICWQVQLVVLMEYVVE